MKSIDLTNQPVHGGYSVAIIYLDESKTFTMLDDEKYKMHKIVENIIIMSSLYFYLAVQVC